MLFNTLPFVIFAALFYPIWHFARKTKTFAWSFLIVASFIFYGWWNWRYVFLLAGAGLVDFTVALLMVQYPKHRKGYLAASLVVNLGSLALFKYLDFGIESINGVLTALGFSGSIAKANLILPVGISFFTFQSMSYTIDVYRGTLKPTRNVLHFLAFIALFPQLLAGPIVRAAQLLPQLENIPEATQEQRWQGIKKIAYGLVKKSIVADAVGEIVNFQYNLEPGPAPSTTLWWTIAVLFAIQIYCDFSGYSDIAVGLAKWMGLEFPENFRHPYLATSFRDYWNRWHISLSTWFRDYVYLPLARKWPGRIGVYAAILITFTSSGLWHGAAWTFVIWGALHGSLLVLENLTGWDRRISKIPGGKWIVTAIVFFTVCLILVVFRAKSISQALSIFRIMFSWQTMEVSWWGRHWPDFLNPFWPIIPLLFVVVHVAGHLGIANTRPIQAFRQTKAAYYLAPFAIGALLLASVFLRGPNSQFIYFQF